MRRSTSVCMIFHDVVELLSSVSPGRLLGLRIATAAIPLAAIGRSGRRVVAAMNIPSITITPSFNVFAMALGPSTDHL